ncbi:MAG: hypothetical protein RJA36_1307 [Pseudomonadota bacterium]|jgi:HK97 family phage major capsid protein/HK97 family phage prohead protease
MRSMSNPSLPHDLARCFGDGRAQRALTVERQAINEEARTVELAFASETPYERWWGVEILDVTATAMRLGRLSSGANLLMDHDTRDVVGVVESVSIGADRVARAAVRFGRSARAEEVWQDVRDGIRRNVSVGYLVHKATLVEASSDGPDTYRVTDWEPFEVSLVSVPADASVGVGRSLQREALAAPDAARAVDPGTSVGARDGAATAGSEGAAVAEVAAAAADVSVSQDSHEEKSMPDISVSERNHAAEISKIAATLPGGAELALSAIQRGLSVEEFQREAIEKLASRPVPSADIGMSRTEAQRFSFMRAINALANPGDRRAQEAARFEREASDAYAARLGRGAQGFFVPVEVQQRDLLVGTTTAGGYTVQTDLLGQNFIDVLRNRMAMTGLGAQFLTGLTGQVAVPRQTAGATSYWVAENNAPTESQQAFDQVALSPKTVGAFTDVSRKLLLQSSIDVEAFVRNDLATVLALAIDLAAINGSGASNQPTGVLNVSGIGSVAGGTNGAIPTWGNLVDLESAVAVANADIGALGYLTNAKVRGKLKQVSKVSGQNGFVWDNGDTPVNGYRAAVSNQVPSNLTKGTASGICSAILFGNWSDLIVGQWGTLDLMVDPYTGSTAGTVRVVALQDVDVAVRHPESFAAMKDALTA